ncbi:target of Nesh-SH3 isoform X15 [Pleurodeles waltl]|uniref:target of Nesh-SH3 isoform X15 n=1 Tax=Pleurodeles waltl TaxID=8319 RepID=UPI00370945B4
MIPRLLCLLFCWDFAVNVGHAQKLLGVKKASLKVQINATSDTVNLKFLRPSPNINLEGFILGYGSNFFSTQYIPLPENGKFYDTELDAEPRYLIAVHPSPVVNSKKNCAGKAKVQKPLQVVVGTLTPTSVYLAWGVLVNPQYDWTVLNKCLTDRFYTVRYREKEKNKKWLFHLCPNTETVIDNLKPNVIYEFGVKDNSEDGIWNKGVTHKTTVPPKHKINGGNGHIQNTYSAPKGHIQVTPEDTKMFIPITMIKQVVQNISIPKKDKSVKASVPPAKIAAVESLPGTKRPALPIVSKKSEAFPVYSESQTERSEYAPSPGLSLSTPAVNDTQRIPAIPGTFEKPVAPQTGTAPQGMMPESLKTRAFIPTEKTGTTEESTRQNIPETITPKSSRNEEQPKATLAFFETPYSSLEPKDLEMPEIPQTNPVHRTSPKPATTKPTRVPRKPSKATHGSKEPPFIPFKDSTSEWPHRPQSTPVPTKIQKDSSSKTKTSKGPHWELAPNEIHKFSSAQPKTTQITKGPLTTPAPKKTQRMPINFIRLRIFGDPDMTSAANDMYKFPSAKPKTTQTTERLLPTHASKKTQRVPINLIRFQIFGGPNITSVPNETQTKSSSKAKTVIPTERPHTKAVPKSTHRMPINLIKLHIFEDPKMSFVPNETQKSSFKPTSPTAEIAKAVPKSTHRMPINLIKLHIFEDPKMSFVPNETQKSSFKPTSPSAEIAKAASKELDTDSIEPNLSVPRQKLGTTLAPKKVHSSSSRPKTSVRLRTRPSNYVPNRTTQGTARPKSSNWRSETSIGAKLTGQDITKLLGVSRNTSMEPNGTVKRPVSGSSQPGTPRAPLPPARPTHMRRRPFYMYNVTGRPGISGNGLVPRARSSSIRHVPQTTRVSIVERTQTPRLKTTSAPEQETVTEPIFNPGPVSELDPMGKPRYTAPHVKYMRKEDLVPCSITESMKHFPNELATNVDEATVRPQNSPSNLTVIAVEGCPSFVILDWKEPDNDTVTEYKVISKENGGTSGKDQSILTTNQTHSTVENLKPNTSYEFKVVAANVLGEGPPSTTVTHNTESVDPRVSEPITGGKDAIWTEIKFKSDTYSECKGKQYIKRTWYKKFVGIQLCNSLRYKIYLSDSLGGKFYNIGDESGYGEDHCQFVDSFLDGRTGQRLLPDQLPPREGFYRSVRQQPVEFGKIGSQTHIRYVQWYECGTTIPGKW